jgi:hypothetical protein
MRYRIRHPLSTSPDDEDSTQWAASVASVSQRNGVGYGVSAHAEALLRDRDRAVLPATRTIKEPRTLSTADVQEPSLVNERSQRGFR